MENNYKRNPINYSAERWKMIVHHPLFGYIIMSLVLIVVQFLYMYTDMISLTVSKAIAQTMAYSIVSMGLSILIGQAGLISLGTAGFMGLGAYVAGNFLKHIPMPFVLMLILTIAIGVVIGIVVGFISLRVKGVHLMIVTLAIAQLMDELFRTPNNFTGGTSGLTQVPYPKLAMFIQLNRETVYFLTLAVLFVVIVLTINIIKSSAGRALQAMRSSRSAAQAMGVNILKYRILAFVLATVYAMIGGALYVCQQQGVTPSSWSMMLSLNILAAVTVGGFMSFSGSIMGSFVIFGLDLAVLKNIEFFEVYPNATVFVSGLLIILITIKFPGGLQRLVHIIANGVRKYHKKWRVYRYGADES